MQNPQDVQRAAQALRACLPPDFRDCGNAIGVILGTGLSQAADILRANGPKIEFAKLPGFPKSDAPSHAGAFIAGTVSGAQVIVQQGRFHLYEGKTPAQVCLGVRVMGALGIKTLIITNAAGALNPAFDAGELMCMLDLINHTGISPLTGPNCDQWGERFPDMSEPFDRGLRGLAMQCSLDLGIRLHEGVYIGVHGPEMETPAETRMYRQWGADAVGMSTALEVIAANHMGMRVLGISCLTNKNLPDCMRPAPLAEILEVAAHAGKKLEKLLAKICGRLNSSVL